MERLRKPLIRALLQRWPQPTRRLLWQAVKAAVRWRCWCSRRSLSLGAVRPPCPTSQEKPIQLMGLNFPNPVGIAAGFDRRGELGRALGWLGVGHVEIGTLTPGSIIEAEAGGSSCNPWVADGCLDVPLGINLGRREQGSLQQGIDDYLHMMNRCWSLADYLVVNLSGPAGRIYVRPECEKWLQRLLVSLQRRAERLAQQTGRSLPLLLKIDVSQGVEEYRPLLQWLGEYRFSGLLAMDSVGGAKNPDLLQGQICRRVATLREGLGPERVLVSVGGILAMDQVQQRLASGADLVQVYNALIYRGPAFTRELVSHYPQ